MDVHQLSQVSPNPTKSSSMIWMARCGTPVEGPPREPMPPQITAWHSGVTCRACLGLSEPNGAPESAPDATK